MKALEIEQRNLRQFSIVAMLMLAVAVLQGIGGRWLVATVAFAVAGIFAYSARARWLAIQSTDPEREAKIKGPDFFDTWFPIFCVMCGVTLVAFTSAVGRPPDALSGLLAAVSLLIADREVRLRRRLVKPPVRYGPPQEWL